MAHVVNWRAAVYGAVLVLSISLACAQQREQQPAASIQVPTERVEFLRFVEAAAARARRSDADLADARATLEAIIANWRFSRQDSALQRVVLTGASVAAHQAEDYPRAHALAIRVTTLGAATAADWHARSVFALDVGDVADSVAALARVAELSGEEMTRVPFGHLTRVVREAADFPDPEANLRLLSRLFDIKWGYKYRGEPSNWWRELALLRLARGDLDEARAVVARIADPSELLRARVDRRFDPLQATDPELFDVAGAAAREVQRLEAEVLAAPDVIEPVLFLVNALETLNRCADALRVVDTAIARAAGPTAEERPFSDGERNFVWLLDSRARLLLCLGRSDDALQQLVQAAALPERGEPNTSQLVNLAAMYNSLGRPADALAAIEAVGERGGYGSMQEQAVRLDAYLQLGNDEGVRTALSYMGEHREESLGIYQAALLLAGDADAAAAVLIARLERKSERADALAELQVFARRPGTATELERGSLLTALVERADVSAAIERVGRVELYLSLGSPPVVISE